MVEKCLGNRGLPWDGLDSKIGRLEANMFEPDGFSCGVGSFRKCLECTNVKRSVKRNNIGSATRGTATNGGINDDRWIGLPVIDILGSSAKTTLPSNKLM